MKNGATKHGAKKHVHRAEEAMHRYRAHAARILNAEGLRGDGE